jgi:gamma-butyrobetaine dioxygenase
MLMTEDIPKTIVDRILHLFAAKGHAAYHGEAVSQTEHALQSACLAEREGAPEDLVVAALLHDVGHLLNGVPEDIADRGIDAVHEDEGADWLAAHFSADIVDPIRLHVAAKRYLCTTDPTYRGRLSAASLQSLRLQGGEMTSAEAAEFEGLPYFRQALRLRTWDDAAKVPGWDVPGLEAYRSRLEAAVRRGKAP